MNVLILAAGLGTRLQPLTNSKPKALVEVGDKTLLQIQLERMEQLGVSNIVVNTHHFSQQVKDFLWKYQETHPHLNLKISDETEHLLNTGGGIKQAGKILKSQGLESPLLIHNVDILDNADLLSLYVQCGREVDAVLLVKSRETSRYLVFDKHMRLVGWINKKTQELKTPYSNLDLTECKLLAFSGIHVVNQRMFELMNDYPDEFSIIDFYINTCQTLHIKGVIQDDLELLDVGKIDILPQAVEFLNKQNKSIL